MASAVLMAVVLAAAAPITQVTVYTDQARVVRSTQVVLSGVQDLELATLPDSVDVSSIRVEATGAEVRRVDIARIEPEKLKTDEVRGLLAQLEKLDFEISRVSQERTADAAQRDAVLRLSPVAPPSEPLRPPVKLNGSGWLASQAFVSEQAARLQAKVREADVQLKKLDEARQPLAEKARKLGDPETRAGWKVTAVLAGNGTAAVSCTYLVANARWTPIWDLQLQPEKNLVSLSLAALVSQETTEDWASTALSLSTAIPSRAVKVPEFASWKIGVAERFIPAPRPLNQQPLQPPPDAPKPSLRQEVDVLRSQLVAVGDLEADKRMASTPRSPPPAPPPPPPVMVAPAPEARRNTLAPRPQREEEVGERDEPAPKSAPSGYGFSGAESPDQLYLVDGLSTTGSLGGKQVAPRFFSLSPPPSWSAPDYGPDSPVTLAGGSDLAFNALQKETIPTARGGRRVALWSAQWPVSVERKLFPAITPDAFLVAELKNPSQQVLPGGLAQLSVGADPSGQARLKLVSPGESFTLPLGIDRALKPIRNVKLVETTQGIISKDELGTYVVTIELANPYPAPIQVRVYDQYPLSAQKEVEVKLLDSKPGASYDSKKGWLEWRVTIPAQQKTSFTFTYTIKRPRGWLLSDSEVAP